jgi:hypothetical protein
MMQMFCAVATVVGQYSLLLRFPVSKKMVMHPG